MRPIKKGGLGGRVFERECDRGREKGNGEMRFKGYCKVEKLFCLNVFLR